MSCRRLIVILLGLLAADVQAAEPTTIPAIEPLWNQPSTQPADDLGDLDFFWDPAILRLLRGTFVWTLQKPLLEPPAADGPVSYRQPAAVRSGERWHVLVVARPATGPRRIEYRSVASLDQLAAAKPVPLDLGPADVASPHLFFHEPAGQWFLIYQTFDEKRQPAVVPMFSTSRDIADPSGWTRGVPLSIPEASFTSLWGDFRVIADEADAFVFYTTADGRIYRSRTSVEAFPQKLSPPVLALRGDFMGSARPYRIANLRRYLLVVEARDLGRRYLRAYVATRLDGTWDALAASELRPFASPANVGRAAGTLAWADSFTDPEILRSAPDQTCPIDCRDLQVLFAGTEAFDRAGAGPGQIPWRLGLLRSPRHGE